MTHQRIHFRRSRYGRRFVAGRRKVTHNEFLYGDFDKDKIPNIDDKKPFEFGGGKVDETELSKELKHLKRHSRSFMPETKKVASLFEREGWKVKYRTKTPFSMINKLRRKFLVNIEDVGGVLVLGKDKSEVFEIGDFIEHNFQVVDVDNYYKYPKDRFYRALHYTIKYGNKLIEIQVKTPGESMRHQEMHKKYKEGNE